MLAPFRPSVSAYVLALAFFIGPAARGDVPRGYAILEELYKQSKGTSYYARMNVPAELAAYDPDLALKLATDVDGKVSDFVLSGIIWAIAETNPAKAAEWAPSKLKAMKAGPSRAFGAMFLGVAVAEIDPALAKELYTLAKEDATVADPEVPFPPGFAHAALSVLAEKVKDGDVDKLADQAIAAATKPMGNNPPPGDELVAAFAELAGRVSPRLMRRYCENLDSEIKVRALARAIPYIAQFDARAARDMLADIEKVPANDTLSSFGQAAKPVVAALGKTDPAGALKLARAVFSTEHKPIALALAAMAEKGETSAAVFREAVLAVPDGRDQRKTLARIAAMAYQTDKALGKELFSETRKRSLAEGGESAFAYYYAQVDAQESRRMIEAAVSALKAQALEPAMAWRFVPWALAAAAVDVDRALEIAKAIPGDAKYDAMRKIAQYVLASDAVRRVMPFDRWCASDTWRPGTPSGW
jgi:hypothetical protein